MHVLIVGAGKTGVHLAEKLEGDHKVTLIDQRPERIELVRTMLPDVRAVLGDACDPSLLEHAGIAESECVVAATGDDEDNLVVAMLAKHYEIGKVYARVNHPANEWLFDADWGVDVAVSSPEVMLGLVQKDIGFGDLITLLKLNVDGVSIEELTIPERATSVGKKLADIDMPPNVTVMAILAAKGYVQAARGDTSIVAGDQFLMLVEGGHDEDRMLRAFGITDATAAPAEGDSPEHG